MDKTPRRVIQSNPTMFFRYHFQVTNSTQNALQRLRYRTELRARYSIALGPLARQFIKPGK
jgi:hypothetical protein